jgi:two-component system OmpR family response regulator
VQARAGTTPPTVLVVDDEENIRFLLTAALRLEGFTVTSAADAVEALRMVRAAPPDLAVLDVMLPDADGFELCRRLRADGFDAPVIFLTARDATEDRVLGLTIGGDDYVVKPFSLEELVARVRVVLRRVGTNEGAHVLCCADLELDDDAHRVTRAGVEIHLTPTEYKLLRYLLLNTGRVVSRAQILDHVWEYDFDGESAIVETYISYLRRKVDGTDPKLIRTVRGVGYMLRAD